MELLRDFLYYITNRWTWITNAAVVAVILLFRYAKHAQGQRYLFYISFYLFLFLFLLANSLLALLSRKRAAEDSLNPGVHPRYPQLRPFSIGFLIVAVLLIPFFGFVTPFNQPVQIYIQGTATSTPTRTPTPTLVPTNTPAPTSTATITYTPSPTPKAQGLYTMIVLDASSKMDDPFDGTTKWAAAQAAANTIISGLEPGASYGLVVVGGSPLAEGVDACDEPSVVNVPFSYLHAVTTQIAALNPAGGGSLFNAYELATSQFEVLPPNSITSLVYITGATDGCAGQDEWSQLAALFKNQAQAEAAHDSELIVLDDGTRPGLGAIADQINSSSSRISIQLPTSLSAVQAASQTVISRLSSYVDFMIANRPTDTPVPTVTLTPTLAPILPTETPSLTPSPTVTWTPSITPTDTAVPPTALQLLSVTFISQGIGCQLDVQVQVTGSPVTGVFHVRNASMGPAGVTYPETTLPVGTNWASSASLSNVLTLPGDQKDSLRHEIWFEYGGVQSNHLTDLFCPGIPPS